MIPRENLEAVLPPNQTPQGHNFYKLSELDKEGNTRLILRKPDFQRETNAWTPNKIVDLIESYLSNDLIPSVILWRSPKNGRVFVIDGAHRLSALISWTFDDYGDGELSRAFFNGRIPEEQQIAANAVRTLIKKRGLGSYGLVKNGIRYPESVSAEQLAWSQDLMSVLEINLQWVRGGPEKAEASFKAINDRATPLDKTEAKLISERKMPTGVCVRAIVHAGTGHQYWGQFEKPVISAIEESSQEVHSLLFEPEDVETAKLRILPIAGKAYTGEGVKLVYDLVDFATRSLRVGGPEKVLFGESVKTLKRMEPDESGEETLRYLKAVKRTIEMITGNSKGSLGLHPAVYIYTITGKRQPTALMAAIRLIEDLKSKKKLNEFTENRREFEEFLVKHKTYINQIVKTAGAEDRSFPSILELLETIYAGIVGGLEEEAIRSEILSKERLKGLIYPDVSKIGKGAFSATAKKVVYSQLALDMAARCGICGARLHENSTTIDHVHRKADGGSSFSDNGVVVHPYCNTGYKESTEFKARVSAAEFELS